MSKLFIEDLSFAGKKTLMRVDFNVPLDNDLNVLDATRIEASLPSIRYILDQGGSLILMSHLGRPKNAPRSELSLAPVAKVLSAMLEKPVTLTPNCIGSKVEAFVDKLQPGEILLLENLRFHRAEEYPDEDPQFAKELASFGDQYVNDAFGTAHRKHSSTYTIAQYFPGKAAAGYLMMREIQYLGNLLTQPVRPFVGIIGGAKVSSKIGVIQALLKKVDKLLIGGGMAYTFFKAQGISIGDSLCEDEFLSQAKELLKSEKILLPIDIVGAQECSKEVPTKTFSIPEGIAEGWQGLDIGPKTLDLFKKQLSGAKTVLWNGPLGVYEIEPFDRGTTALAKAIVQLKVTSVVGGGDLVSALNQAEVLDKITHVSTGGGATLEYIEYGTLPGIEALSDIDD